MSDAERLPNPAKGVRRAGLHGITWRAMRLWIALAVGALALLVVVVSVTVTVNAGSDTPRVPLPPTSIPARLRAPHSLYVTGTPDGAVLLSWQPPQPAPLGYRIYRAAGHSERYTIVGSVESPQISTFADNAGLVPGTTYAYTVTAFDRNGESAPAGPVFALLMAPFGTPSPTMGAPAPLPTLPPVTSATLTAVARASGMTSGPLPTTPLTMTVTPVTGGASSGIVVPTALPTVPLATIAVPTTLPAGYVVPTPVPAATPVPTATAVPTPTPVATPTPVPTPPPLATPASTFAP